MLENLASILRSGVGTTASLALLAVFVGAGCGGESIAGQGDAGSGRETDAGGGDAADTGLPDGSGPAPLYHRPDDAQCTTARPAGSCPGTGTGAGVMCASDSQCTDGGADGRCTNSAGGPAGCSCTYDECQTDSNCATGQLCVCHGSGYSYGGNVCMPGNCRVDSDCGANGYCSPAHGTGNNCGYVSGYYCHTPKDSCTNDSDCNGGTDVCTWSTTDERWECQAGQFCA